MATSRFDGTRLAQMQRVSAVAASPDSTWLAVHVQRVDEKGAKYIGDLWRVPLDGAEPTQLTRGESNDRAPCFRADGALGFISNREAGDDNPERGQVWILPATGGEPQPLTDEPLGVSAFKFAKRGDRLVVLADVYPDVEHDKQRAHHTDRSKNGPSGFLYKAMPVRYWDYWLTPHAPHVIAYRGDGTERRDLTPDADRDHREAQWDLSEDGQSVVITRLARGGDLIDDVCLAVIDTSSGAVQDVGAEAAVQLGAPRFSPDGTRIAASREFRDKTHVRATLWIADRDSGEHREVAADWHLWPSPIAWTPDGEQVLVSSDERGRQTVFSIHADNGEIARMLDESVNGVHEAMSVLPDGTALVGVRHSITQAPEPFRAALAPNAKPELVANLTGWSDEDRALGTVESFETKAEDGVDVQSFLVRPAKQSKEPVSFWIHGGPISSFQDGWHWRWNPLVAVAEGYAVALPNPRGSTGFGQKFVDGIWGNAWGAACYTDLMAVADALAARDDLDGSRMMAMGGSFGGYMSNWIGGKTDRFKCIVTHASLYWLSAFYGVTDEPGWFALEHGGVTPYDSLEEFDKYSPQKNVANWKTPTLVIHGEKDYRVPVAEGLSLFQALQLHGVDSELLLFPDENHWILKPRNVTLWYDTVIGYMNRYMK